MGCVREPLDDLSDQRRRQHPHRALDRRRRHVHEGHRDRPGQGRERERARSEAAPGRRAQRHAERRPAVDLGGRGKRVGELRELPSRGGASVGRAGDGPGCVRDVQRAGERADVERARKLRRHGGRSWRSGHGDVPGPDERQRRLAHLHGGRSGRARSRGVSDAGAAGAEPRRGSPTARSTRRRAWGGTGAVGLTRAASTRSGRKR